MATYLFRIEQITEIKQTYIAILKHDIFPPKIILKYVNSTKIHLLDLIIKLFKNIKISKQAIKLVDNKQLFYVFIDTLNLMELKTLRTFIEIYLKPKFIQFFKFFISVLIFINKKPNSNSQLCDNY